MPLQRKPLWNATSGWAAILLLILATKMERSVLGTPKEKEKQAEPFALLIGTCFDETGFSLSGAKVIIQLMSSESGTKKWERLSSPRGEFAVRLPPGKNSFRVTASKDGFQSAEKTVSFEGEERLDLMLHLQREPRRK